MLEKLLSIDVAEGGDAPKLSLNDQPIKSSYIRKLLPQPPRIEN